MAITNRRSGVIPFHRLNKTPLLGVGRLLFRPRLPMIPHAEGLFPIQFLLWELVLADVAEAEFIEAAVS